MSDIGWYSAAYRLAKCSFQFMFGKLYRMFSVKWIFMISITISLLGSILSSAATTSAMFVLGRAVCGEFMNISETSVILSLTLIDRWQVSEGLVLSLDATPF